MLAACGPSVDFVQPSEHPSISQNVLMFSPSLQKAAYIVKKLM
jgi:hypothetical protein